LDFFFLLKKKQKEIEALIINALDKGPHNGFRRSSQPGRQHTPLQEIILNLNRRRLNFVNPVSLL
jgi:hypothetical protein